LEEGKRLKAMKEEEIEKEETTEKLRKELEGAAENEYK